VLFVGKYKNFAAITFTENCALLNDLTQLVWWDEDTAQMSGLLTETLQLLCCVNGELVVKYLQSNPYPSQFEKANENVIGEFEDCYKIAIELSPVYASVYKIICDLGKGGGIFFLHYFKSCMLHAK
jgi:hypothetical protein